MATISGRVIFDRDRSVTFSSGDAGMVNIPVVLQNVGTGARLTVLTDTNGNFIFFNVPNGNYRLVESYGTFGGVPSPGDFSAAVPNGIPVGADPPVTSAVNPPAGTTNLDSVTPNTLFFTVTGADITDRNFFDGPVIYTPIQTILDPCAVISGENLITVADSGTFGSFPQGTPANTGAPVEPYSGVTPDFTYVLPNPSAFTPAGGEYTVQNIMNDAMSTQIGAWWRIADHTSGDETGRMMVVNGFNPGAVFFRSVVQVQPNTNYLFAAWILNLFKVTGYPNPELGVRILDQDGNILYSDTLGAQIPPNVNAPEWKEIGSTLNSRDNTSLTVEFLSEGPEVIGNDYAIDDISFNEIQVPQFIPVKSVDRQSANVGETVRFTVTLTNACTSPLTGVFFQDTLPDGLSFAEGSVTVDGTPEPASNPETGFALPDVPGGATVTVSFDAKVDAVPTPNPTLNSAAVRYLYTPVEGGIPSTFDVRSNEVPVVVAAEADLSVLKTASPDAVSPGDTLTYTLTVSNAGPSPAENVVLTDSTPVFLSGAEFSVDGGLTWNPWITPYTLGSFASGESRTVLLRGTVAPAAVSSIENTASVASSTPDPDLSNNTSTVNTPVNTSADISVVKLGAPKPAIPGELLTYTIAVANAGPSAAENVVLADTVPDALTNVEFSTDNGLSYQTWTGSAALGDLASGIVRTVLLRGRVSAAAAGTIVNTAVVSSDTPDPDPGNNSSTDETAVAVSADVGVMKTGSPSPVTIGDTLTYTVTVTNAGPSDAQDVTLTDTLPAGLTGGEYSLDGGITFQPWTGAATLGTLAAGAFRTVLLRAEVSDTVGETVRNTAVVSATTPDPNPGNNQSTVITPIDTSADLSVTKSGSPNPAVPGEFLIYSITVRNAGPDASLNTVLTDTLPSELSGAEYSVDGGNTWSPWAGSFAIGTLAAGGVRTVFLRGVLDAAASGILTNTATVSSDTPDPDPGNNETTVLVPVGVSADLTVRKSALPVPVEAGGVLTYTIVVTNAGPSTAQDVTLTDAVPPVIENPEFRVQGGTVFSPWVSPYVIGELAAGETFTITIRGTVNPATPRGTILNTAVVSSSTPDPDPTDNTDTIETPVIPSADLAVERPAPPILPCRAKRFSIPFL